MSMSANGVQQTIFTDCKILSLIGIQNKSRYNDQNHHYTYQRENKEYVIASGMLNSLFETYGYCVDPGARNPISLTQESIDKLKGLASEYDDKVLLATINKISNAKAPSPRMMNDGLMHETTFTEKKRFENLTNYNRNQILILLETILNVGMYLAGWKGNEEPYITNPRNNYDIVRVELKVFPLIQSLYVNPNYLKVKNFPIIGYFQTTNIGSIKPSVIDNKFNIDKCLNQIGLDVTPNEQLASYLISTSYYYITSICDTPLPMIEPLIHNLAS